VVDASNVVGARPDGWWRDRPAAIRRLLERLVRYAGTWDGGIELVLDVAPPDLPEGDHEGVTVHHARRRGRNAADDRIRELLVDLCDGVGDVTVVTSDRELAVSARAAGARVVGAGAFLARLEAAGC
jgi:predicted RNA-binding protein with PIN domain